MPIEVGVSEEKVNRFVGWEQYNDKLELGRSIERLGLSQSGSWGGFVRLVKNQVDQGTFAVSCHHCFFDPTDLAES
ncbi:MAG: hypothetical protein M1837_007177, partial [Sclerophora amabilis]